MSHSHAHEQELSFDDRIVRVLEHWIKHNDDHIANYYEWVAKLNAADKGTAADLLQEAAEMSTIISKKFQTIIDKL